MRHSKISTEVNLYIFKVIRGWRCHLVLGWMINGNKDNMTCVINMSLGTSQQRKGINSSNCIYPSGVGFD